VGQDSFRIVTTLDGFLNFDSTIHSLILDLGGFKITVPPGTFVFDAKGVKGKCVIAVGDGSVAFALDLGTGVLSVKGSKLNIGQNLGGSVIVGATVGSFNQANLLVLTEKVKKGASDFSF
jgi:hypothetical protein